MGQYFEKIADFMPSSVRNHLPAWMTQQWLREGFYKDMRKMLAW
jgi:hypothetical protein